MRFYDRNDNPEGAGFLKAELWDEDDGEDDVLATVYLDQEGYFVFPGVENNDPDDTDLNDNLDLYITWTTVSENGTIAVTNFGDRPYRGISQVYRDVEDGDFNSVWTLQLGDANVSAFWIFDDVTSSLAWVRENIHEVGNVAFRWESGENSMGLCTASCLNPILPIFGVFIADPDILAPDVIRHEMAHGLMYRKRDNNFWFDLGEEAGINDWISCVFGGHNFSDPNTPLCSTLEGWADWFAILTDGDEGDTCFDFTPQSCGIPEASVNLEEDLRDADQIGGDTIERWTSGTFNDWEDSSQDGIDIADFTAEEVWNATVTHNSVRSIWDEWPYDRHTAVMALHQNKIEYNTPPQVNVPGFHFPSDGNFDFSLQEYAEDLESDAQLLWTLTQNTGECPIVLNPNGDLVINPGPVKTCQIAVEVTDGLATTTDTFEIRFYDATRMYIPIGFK